MKYEDILVYLGQFGKYQKLRYAFLCLPAGTIAMQIMAFVYILAVPKHRCAVPGFPNDTYAIQNEAHEAIIRAFIPIDPETEEFSSCHSFNSSLDSEVLVGLSNTTWQSRPAILKCRSWVYDKSHFTSTIISKFDLVCEDKLARSHSQMIFMIGGLLASLFIGPLADLFGRKKAFMGAVLLHFIAGLAVALSPSYIYLAITFFINGVACASIYIVGFVLGMEIVGVQKRVFAGTMIAVLFGVGVIVVVGVAYFIRDWRHLQAAISIPPIFFLSYYWLIDESPRWLISKKRYPEAKVLLEKMARINDKELPAKALQWDEVELDKGDNRVSLWKICNYPKLLLRTLVIYFIWFVATLTYYGLALNVGDLAGSIYLNAFLYGVVEIASYLMCIFLLDRVGRKALFVTCILVAGVACLLSPFPRLYGDANWLSVLFAIMGKFGISAAFAAIWVYSTELYPTVIRNSAVASSSFVGRIGKVISPYIANMGTTVEGNLGKILPFAIFGGGALIAGLLAIVLPETKDRPMPESLEETNSFGSKPPKPKLKNGDKESEEALEMMAQEKENGHRNPSEHRV